MKKAESTAAALGVSISGLIKIAMLATMLSLTATIAVAQEIVDGGPDNPTTARKGMHACPVGYYMTGIDVSNNAFLCNNLGSGYQESQEVVDSSTEDFSMHACPNGQVMSGFHDGRNLLLCVPPPSAGASTARLVDYDTVKTVRQNMHACAPGLPMTGIHVRSNNLLCEYRSW
jgi:hypothetical protein